MARAEQRVWVYSGYTGHTYKRTSANFPSDLASAYSVDWALLAKAGLGAAVAGVCKRIGCRGWGGVRGAQRPMAG